MVLEKDARLHAINALRLKAGSEIILFNGDGGEFSAIISKCSRKNVEVTTSKYLDISLESHLKTFVAVGLSRSDRMDWIVQKTTELGANHIIPIISERVTVNLNLDRAKNRLAHWRRISISSCEQCGRNSLPTINEPIKLDSWLRTVHSPLKYILDQSGSHIDLKQLKPSSITLLSGPEGGFSENEIELAQSSGFLPISLGKRTMRAETAPLAALAITQSRWGDLC